MDCSYDPLSRYNSVLHGQFAEASLIPADVNIDPNVLLLKDEGYGFWMTAYIRLPEDYDVEDIDVTSIMLKVGSVKVPVSRSDAKGDVLVVRFDRRTVVSLLRPITEHMFPHVKQEVTLTIVGRLFDGEAFEGSDVISVFFV